MEKQGRIVLDGGGGRQVQNCRPVFFNLSGSPENSSDVQIHLSARALAELMQITEFTGNDRISLICLFL